MSTPYDADLGARQGRIQPAGWTTPDGSYVFCLGHDTPGTERMVMQGDQVAITQTFDLASLPTQPSVIRFRARVRAHTISGTPTPTWSFRILVDGDEVYALGIPINQRVRDLRDLVVPVMASPTAPDVKLVLQVDYSHSQVVRGELPAVYLDAFTPDPVGLSIPGNPVIAFRSPEPGETGVPATEVISVGAMNVYPVLGVSSLDVYVNGALIANVNDAGVQSIASGWSYSFAQIDVPNGTQPLVRLQPPGGLFAPLEVVTVRAVASGSNGTTTDTTDVTWTYKVADTLGPEIEQALAIAMTEVSLHFDEPVLQVDEAGALDATNPANYVIDLLDGAPAVTPSVLSVSVVDPANVVLQLDKIMTRNATYRVTALVADLVGNAATAPNNAAVFTGYAEPWPAGRKLDFFSMLPQDIRLEDATGDLWKFCACIQEVIEVLLALADRWLDILDPDIAPEPWVDAMLADLGNPFPFTLTLLEKRKLVQLLLAIYKSKGTGPGIVDAVRLFLEIEVTINVYAWSPYPIGVAVVGQTFILGSNDQADLYTFQIIVPQFLSDEQRARIDAIADYMKVGHEHHVIVEPTPPGGPVSHWQLGYSRLGTESLLH